MKTISITNLELDDLITLVEDNANDNPPYSHVRTPPPQLYTDEEAAHMFRIPVSSFRRLRYNRKIEFIKIGRKRLTSVIQINKYLSENTYRAETTVEKKYPRVSLLQVKLHAQRSLAEEPEMFEVIEMLKELEMFEGLEIPELLEKLDGFNMLEVLGMLYEFDMLDGLKMSEVLEMLSFGSSFHEFNC